MQNISCNNTSHTLKGDIVLKRLIVLVLLICCVGSVFAANHDNGTYRVWVTAIGAPYYQVYIDGLPLTIFNVGTFGLEEANPGYHDVGVQLLGFDYEPLGGESYQERCNVYVAKDGITNVYFNFDETGWIPRW